jgi:hypothetical protein
MNQINLFIVNIFKIIAVFITLIIIQFFLFKVLLTNNVNFEVSKDKTILILGDSQTETALNDSILKNCINFSKAGDPLFFNYIKLKKIIKNNTHIKTIILGFSPSNLDSKGFYEVPKMKSKFITYFYLIDYPNYIDIIKYNPEGLIRGLSGLGKYFIQLNEIIKGKGIEDMKIGGFRPIPYKISELKENIKKDTLIAKSNPNQIAIKYFTKIVELCETKGLKLIVVNTPIHKSLSKRQLSRKEGYNMFFRESHPDIILLDYENLKMDDIYYFDNNHLNYKGANIFSEYVNVELNKFKMISKNYFKK